MQTKVISFVEFNITKLFDRFNVSYCIKGTKLYYSLHEGKTQLPSLLVFEYRTDEDENHLDYFTSCPYIFIKNFNPELRTLGNTDKLSAALFYVLISHAFSLFPDATNIILSSEKGVNERFYRKLKDLEIFEHPAIFGNDGYILQIKEPTKGLGKFHSYIKEEP